MSKRADGDASRRGRPHYRTFRELAECRHISGLVHLGAAIPPRHGCFAPNGPATSGPERAARVTATGQLGSCDRVVGAWLFHVAKRSSASRPN